MTFDLFNGVVTFELLMETFEVTQLEHISLLYYGFCIIVMGKSLENMTHNLYKQSVQQIGFCWSEIKIKEIRIFSKDNKYILDTFERIVGDHCPITLCPVRLRKQRKGCGFPKIIWLCIYFWVSVVTRWF